jgi:dihydroflavonol-4-reductase
MKVLLTGASGFVGSHVLDSLRRRNISVALLLRPGSSRAFLQPHLPAVTIHAGSIGEPESLRQALDGVSHIIHCAGCVKAARVEDFYNINQVGTRALVAAANSTGARIKRFVFVSSLAAAGPASANRPRRETEEPQPVSEYGRSKLAGERELQLLQNSECVIIRPPAVYGPRDTAFLSLFKAVQRHLLPAPNSKQALSLVYVKDLAESIVRCLDHPDVVGKSYFVASRQIVSALDIGRAIARQTGSWTLTLPLPPIALWPVCLACEWSSRITGKAHILSLQKFPELAAQGWVCDPSAFCQDTGYQCPTSLEQGVAETLEWYRQAQWLARPRPA